MSFDTERFISEIETRRALWDMSCEDYADRDLKRMMWENLTEIFGGEDLSINEKKELGLSLQKKWKNIRDSFLRELRRIKGAKSGSGATRKSPYVYFHHLMFLKPTVEPNITESNLDDGENRDPNPIPESVSQGAPRSKKKKEDDNLEREDLVSILKESIKSRNEQALRNEDDSDRMFLLSLLKDFRTIPESAKMTTKIEIIKVIQQAQSGLHDPSFNRNEQYEPMLNHSQPAYSRSSYPNTTYHQQYRQGYFSKPSDNGRLATKRCHPPVSRDVPSIDSPPMDSEREENSIESPELISDMFINL